LKKREEGTDSRWKINKGEEVKIRERYRKGREMKIRHKN
jgi:hypothetical protein